MTEQKNLEEKLSELLGEITEFYKAKIKEGNLSSQEQKNLIQLLRDNEITTEIVKKAENKIFTDDGEGEESNNNDEFLEFLEEANIDLE